MLDLLLGGIHQTACLPGGRDGRFRAVGLDLVFHIGVEICVGLRPGHAAGGLSVIPDNAVVPDLGPDDPVVLPLGPGLQGVVRGIRIAAVQIHHRVDAHPHIIRPVQWQQHLHDPGADQVVVLLLQLQLELGGILYIRKVRIGGIGVAVRIGNLHVFHIQSGQAVADQAADGPDLIFIQGLAVLHGHLYGGGGIYLAPLSST